DLPRVFGDLALIKALGRNERGEVYIALRREGVDRVCVVDLLPKALSSAPGLTNGLQAQAGWLVARVHGNLVQIYDIGQADDRIFFVSEFVEGTDLATLVTRAAPQGLSAEIAVYVALEIAAAFRFIRSTEERLTGISTSRVADSASSIMVARDGTVKLRDRGSAFARVAAGLGLEGAGRASVVAPEELSGGRTG